MARRITRPSRFVQTPRRTMVWSSNRLGATTLTGSAKTVVLSLTAAELAMRPFTIVRTRVDGLFSTDQAAVTEAPTGALGGTIVSDQASAIGATAIPGPTSDHDADWYVYQGLTHEFTFLSSVGFDDNAGTHFTIDSKAMRKVGENDDVIWIVQIASAAGAVLNLEGRFLLKLH